MAETDRQQGTSAAGAPLVVAFGEALWDLFPTGPVLGGAPLNFAYRCLTLGARGVMVSRLGTDELGARAEEQMRSLGMELTGIQRDRERKTGTVAVSLDDRGNPDYTIVRDVAYDYIELAPGIDRLLSACACLCYGTLAQRAPQSRSTLARLLDAFRGRYLLLDVNLRRDCYTPETVRSSVGWADIVKMNEEEVPEVAAACGIPAGPVPDVARRLLDAADLEYCVVTLGERGCFAASREGEALYEPAYLVSLVDTCGSGDAFTAAFLCSILSGRELRAACRSGNALGAMVAGQAGATQPVAPGELEAFAARGPRAPEDERFRAYRGPA
jgi:fructokinase